jgi:AbrB family looped-hinge helix DNA binding protein
LSGIAGFTQAERPNGDLIPQSLTFFLAKIRVVAYILTCKILKIRSAAMPNLATTKMSSKGQVVIPEGIRKRLGLKAGAQFVVVGDKDVVILKAISTPSMEDFDALISEARKEARKTGMKRSDIKAAIAKVRSNK